MKASLNRSSWVGGLARNRVVEHLVENVCHRPAEELGDLIQMVYEILLRKPERDIQRVVNNRATNYYIVAIIQNLYFSKTSPYHRTIRRPGQHDEVPEAAGDSPADREVSEPLQQALAALSEDERTLFMRYVEVGSLRGLARELGISPTTLHHRIGVIRSKIKNFKH